MAKIPFSKLNLKLNKEVATIALAEDIVIEVKQYLPQTEKAKLIEFVLSNAIDDKTSSFSPIRIETYFFLAVVKYYTNITFTEKQLEDAPKTYDLLESNEIFAQVISAIPEEELRFIDECVNATAKDISAFNNSLAGIISNMSAEATSTNMQLNDILERIKNKEGIETLAEIRNIVG